jgi:DNA-binding LacI/PurR family transcriptional regulator
MTTIRDVAKRAEVSVSTVSYALSGSRPISEETKQRINIAINELGYRPNFLARSLATKRTRVVALLLPSSANGLSDAQMEFVTSAAEVASQRSYGLLLWTSPGKDQEILRLAREGLVEGVMLMEIRLQDPRVDMLLENGYPFSMIGRCQNNDAISFVDFDFDQALRVCVEHLAQLGHHHIAYLGYPPSELASGYGPAVRSQEGFQAAIKERGLLGESLACEPTLEKGIKTMRALLTKHSDLSAAIIADERICAGVIQVIHEKGLRMPEEFSIIAKVFPRMAEMTTPPLTTLDIPAIDMGRLGTELLIRQLEGDEEQPTQILLPPKLTIRKSTGSYNKVLE